MGENEALQTLKLVENELRLQNDAGLADEVEEAHEALANGSSS